MDELAGLFLVHGLFAPMIGELLLLGRVQVDDLAGDLLLLLTTRVGVWTKPNSETVAIEESGRLMRPMFGPSGVSIGHMRP